MRSPILYCDRCRKPYTPDQQHCIKNGALSMQCSGCYTTREFVSRSRAVFLQPVMMDTGIRLLVIFSEESGEWELPNRHIRTNETVDNTFRRVMEHLVGMPMEPRNLSIYAYIGNPDKEESLLFFENKRPIRSPLVIGKSKFLQTVDEVLFSSPFHKEVSDRYLNNLWRHFHP